MSVRKDGRWIVTRDARFLAEEVIALKLVDRDGDHEEEHGHGKKGAEILFRNGVAMFTSSHYEHVARVLEEFESPGFLKLTIGAARKKTAAQKRK